jgi:4,5-DOPA dioxygenase extradiol
VHNLRQVDWNNPHGAYDWAREFDARVKLAVDRRDADRLAAPEHWGKHLRASAHPTAEHYLPLLYCAGAADERDAVSHPYEGFEFGSISMRAVLFGGSGEDRS